MNLKRIIPKTLNDTLKQMAKEDFLRHGYDLALSPMENPMISNQPHEQTWKEEDPNGIPANSPGAKLDAGKVRPRLVLDGFARALWAVADIGTYGAEKYTDGGWAEVPDGFNRYKDAQYRHSLKAATGEIYDRDSMKLHYAHEAWNALAKLELYLRQQDEANRSLGLRG